MLRGTADTAKMPVPGTFFDAVIRTEVDAKLKAAGIAPLKLYFSGDDWSEVASSGILADGRGLSAA